ncbi:MAG: hypothetical protein L3J04_03830 [Robiginitomaculum sp.]|nr:hypothetical protein [Robiginitomaculum sp.]
MPAIIAQLDNRRRLKYRYLILENHSPKLMVDALATILIQLTGQSFGTISNGATNTKRDNTVNGWRVYAMTHPDFENARASLGSE